MSHQSSSRKTHSKDNKPSPIGTRAYVASILPAPSKGSEVPKTTGNEAAATNRFSVLAETNDDLGKKDSYDSDFPDTLSTEGNKLHTPPTDL